MSIRRFTCPQCGATFQEKGRPHYVTLTIIAALSLITAFLAMIVYSPFPK